MNLEEDTLLQTGQSYQRISDSFSNVSLFFSCIQTYPGAVQ